MPCPSPFSTQQSEGSFKNMNLIIFLALFHPFHLPRLCMAGSISSFSSWFKCCLIRGPPLTAPANRQPPSSVILCLCPFWVYFTAFITICNCLFVCLFVVYLFDSLSPPSGWPGPRRQGLSFSAYCSIPKTQQQAWCMVGVLNINFWKNRRVIFD